MNTPDFDDQGRFICSPEHAAKFQTWINTRGGIAVWQSKLIGEPFKSWSTPAIKLDTGEPYAQPHWSTGKTPDHTITDPAKVVVETKREVERYTKYPFTETGRLTSGFQKWMAKRETMYPGCWWDEVDGDVVVFVRDQLIPLNEWMEAHRS